MKGIRIATLGAALVAFAVLVVSAELAVGAVMVTRVSVSTSGGQADRSSRVVAVSPDGRYVLLDSAADNLVRGDTNRYRDVLLRDVVAGRTIRVDLGPGGRQANGRSWGAAVSANGRFVLFMSAATNLTRHVDTNHEADVFLRDRVAQKTYRVSYRPNGQQFKDAPFGGLVTGGVSDDGRYVAFGEYVPSKPSGCCQTMRAYLRDRRTMQTHLLASGTGGAGAIPVAISASGQYVLIQYLDDHQDAAALVLRNRALSKNIAIPVGRASITRAVMTPNADYVALSVLNGATSGWDVERWSRISGNVRPVIENSAAENRPIGVSSDGRYVAFVSEDSTLVASDTNKARDIFRRDLQTHTVTRIDLTSAGGQIPLGSGVGALSGDGAALAFQTADANVVPGDTNHVGDVFLRSGF